ncbi:MAG: invasion associated locus B family protein [Roseinatronobacter sp.]|jgi:invasion protein IalB|nr:MAG: invasion associated locus B family protein [Roseinatronobacter sp.]
MAQRIVEIFRTTMVATAFSLAAGSLYAQEATDSPMAGLSTGEVIGQDAGDESYVGNTHDDWELVCVRVEDEQDPCQMYQLLRDGEGNATAEITVFPLPPGQEAAAGATILTPLDTLLTAQLVMQVDDGDAKRYPFTFCTAIGCIARVGFTAEEVDAFRRGARATWSLVPVAAPDQVVDLNMSLIGFTAAFTELSEQLGE